MGHNRFVLFKSLLFFHSRSNLQINSLLKQEENDIIQINFKILGMINLAFYIPDKSSFCFVILG